jgi:hypothetical protein
MKRSRPNRKIKTGYASNKRPKRKQHKLSTPGGSLLYLYEGLCINRHDLLLFYSNTHDFLFFVLSSLVLCPQMTVSTNDGTLEILVDPCDAR